MKVLGLSCSPRKGGNTEILIREALSSAEEAGAKVEYTSVVGKEMKPCDGCASCLKTGVCHIKDDVQIIFGKMLESDAIIMGSPAYSRDVTAQTKIILDRSMSLTHPYHKLRNKVGAPVSVASRTGNWNVITCLYLYFVTHHMFCADSVSGIAFAKEAVRNDERAMKEAWELGKEVVELVNKKLEWPAEYSGRFYAQVMEKYGLKRSPFD